MGRLRALAKERVERDEEDLVRLYLTDIGQYPLLNKDDEVRLAQDIEARTGALEELKKPRKSITPAALLRGSASSAPSTA